MLPWPVAGARNSRLVLAAMIFAVAMTFIDQTIVAIAVPELQKDLSLSSTGVPRRGLSISQIAMVPPSHSVSRTRARMAAASTGLK